MNDKGVEYLLVGGQAVIAHGYPRLTKDLDLWVRPTRGNGELVLEALAEFGAPVKLPVEQFENPRTLLVLGREPFRVDILTSIQGLDFEQAWLERDGVVLEGVASKPSAGSKILLTLKHSKRWIDRRADRPAAAELKPALATRAVADEWGSAS